MTPQDKATYIAPAPGDVLLFQVTRIVTNLFKNNLGALENIAADHDEAMAKFEAALPAQYKEYVNLGDYLTEEKGARLRKQTLDAGNDAIREISRLFAFYNIEMK
jgi:hypothetical protein